MQREEFDRRRLGDAVGSLRLLDLAQVAAQTWVLPLPGDALRDRLTALFLRKGIELPRQVVETSAPLALIRSRAFGLRFDLRRGASAGNAPHQQKTKAEHSARPDQAQQMTVYALKEPDDLIPVLALRQQKENQVSPDL